MHDRLVVREGVEGCRDIRLLHVDVSEAHRDVGKARGDRRDERRRRRPALRGGRAVRDREEGGARHGAHCARPAFRAGCGGAVTRVPDPTRVMDRCLQAG